MEAPSPPTENHPLEDTDIPSSSSARSIILANIIVGIVFILLLINMDIFVLRIPNSQPSNNNNTPVLRSPSSTISETESSPRLEHIGNAPMSSYINSMGIRYIPSTRYGLSFHITYVFDRTKEYIESTRSEYMNHRVDGKGVLNFIVHKSAFKPFSISIIDLLLIHSNDNSIHQLLLTGMTANDAHKSTFVGSTNLQQFSLINDGLRGGGYSNNGDEEGGVPERCTINGVIDYLPDFKYSKSLKIIDEQQFQSYKKMLDDTSENSIEHKQWGKHIVKDGDLTSPLSSVFVGSRRLHSAINTPPTPSLPDPDVYGSIISADCGFAIRFRGDEVDVQGLINTVNIFSVCYHIKTIIEMRLMWQQIRQMSSFNSYAKLSTATALLGGFLSCMEASFLLFIGILSQHVVSYFASMAFIKYSFFFMEMRYFSNAWRESHGNTAADNEFLVKLFRFYFVAVPCGLAFAYVCFFYLPYLLPLLYLVWIPQILCDIWYGHRNSLEPYYLFFMSIMRIALPIYIFGIPNNLFVDEVFQVANHIPRPSVAISIAALMCTQCLYAFMQQRKGPRYMVPHFLLPHVYNFHRPIPIAAFELGTRECVVCLNKIDLTDHTHVCTTPCDHYFHSKCLLQWMDVKMECPICRRTLPPYG